MGAAVRLPGNDPRVKVALRKAARKLLRELRAARGDVPERFRPYVDDPVGFAKDVLGVRLWERQAAFVRAAALHPRILARSGHKCGKSIACVVLALWWVCTRVRGRVVLTAPTFHQVKDILWRELKRWYPKVQSLLEGEDLPKDPATALQLPNGAEIIGLSTAKPENLAGISGANLLFIVDEASGFPDDLYEVVEGNSAGDGSKIVGISNPTRTVGWFYEAFRSGTYDLTPSANDNGVPWGTPEWDELEVARQRWRLIHISSEDTPNATNPDKSTHVPGLATRAYLLKMRRGAGDDWESSAVYLVRVRGEFPTEATDAVIGLGLVNAARRRWAPDSPVHGELALGVDVARFGDDETVIQAVRGSYAWPVSTLAKANGPRIAEEVVRVAVSLRRPGERVRVNVDGIGVGASVVDALHCHPAMQEGWLYVVDVNVGTDADDEDHVNLRSQLWFGIADWLRVGGALPEDDALTSELVAPTYSFDARGRKRVLEKREIRKLLKRSPDRADALALAVYRGKGVEYGYEPVKRSPEAAFEAFEEESSGDRYGML